MFTLQIKSDQVQGTRYRATGAKAKISDPYKVTVAGNPANLEKIW